MQLDRSVHVFSDGRIPIEAPPEEARDLMPWIERGPGRGGGSETVPTRGGRSPGTAVARKSGLGDLNGVAARRRTA